jgi:hypothetical protein
MKRFIAVFFFICIYQAAFAQEVDGVLIRCGTSAGQAFFFQDEVYSPSGSEWVEDEFSTGKIILVKLGEEWDIQFDDLLGSNGYRQDGAKVIPLLNKPGMLTVGAFHSNYADIYTFDFAHKVVAWSSNKLGPFAPKVAVYTATCE